MVHVLTDIVSGNPDTSSDTLVLRIATMDYVEQEDTQDELFQHNITGQVKKLLLPDFAAFVINGYVRGETFY